MEYGSVFGHGAYLGPDFTADYLRRVVGLRAARLRRRAARTGRPADDRGLPHEPLRRGERDAHADRAQAEAHRRLVGHYRRFFSEPTTKHGLRPEAITDRNDLRQLTAFFAWTAWAGSTDRPGHNYSYTNNWPPEPRVDNRPTANVVVWSVLSLIALLGGIGILFGVFGRWRFLGWHGREQASAVVPRARRRGADAGPARLRVVLLRDGRAVPDPDVRRRRVPALPRGDRQLLRLRPRADLPVQPDAHLARPARAVLGRHLVRRGRASSWRR